MTTKISADFSSMVPTSGVEIFSKTDWVIGDFPNGTKYVGSDGLVSASSTVPRFDFRPYRNVVVYIMFGGLTGGTSPAIEVDLNYYDSSDTAAPRYGSIYTSVPAAGLTSVMMTNVGQNDKTGSDNWFSSPVVLNVLPIQFGTLSYFVSGTPAGLTSPARLVLFGVR